MRHLTYLVTIFVFCGSALMVIWKREGRILRKSELALLIMTLLGVPFAAAEWFALHWKAWDYSAVTTLNIRAGAELETYLFSAGVFACVAAATLVLVAKTDKTNAAKKKRVRAKSRRMATKKPKLAYARVKAGH